MIPIYLLPFHTDNITYFLEANKCYIVMSLLFAFFFIIDYISELTHLRVHETISSMAVQGNNITSYSVCCTQLFRPRSREDVVPRTLPFPLYDIRHTL